MKFLKDTGDGTNAGAAEPEKEYVQFTEVKDEDVDKDLGKQANTASNQQQPGEGEKQQQQQHQNEYGPQKPQEPESIDAEVITDNIDNGEDLAIATVGLLETLRENILAPLRERQLKMLLDPFVLHKTETKLRMKKRGIVCDEFTDEELQALDTIEEIQNYTSAATYNPDKKEKYIQKWRNFYVSMGWDKKLPPWVSLAITVVVTEVAFALPVISHWWSHRNAKPQKQQEQYKKAV